MEKAKHNTDAFEKWYNPLGWPPDKTNSRVIAESSRQASERVEAEKIVAGLLNVIGYLDTSLFGTGEGFTLEREAIAKAQNWQKRGGV